LQLLIQSDEQSDRRFVGSNRFAERGNPAGEPRCLRCNFQKWNQLLGERRRIRERILLGVRLDEEVERVDDRHVGG
jgi:hypothetical protein